MTQAFVCDAVRTPIGRFGGALAPMRTDDLAAHPIQALMARNPGLDWAALDDVYYGCANQAGEAHCRNSFSISRAMISCWICEVPS